MTTVRIPRRFYDDHRDRGCPTPPAVRETKRHVWIDPEHPDTADLVSDARYYSDLAGMDVNPWMLGLMRSARATLDALPDAVERLRRDIAYQASLDRDYADCVSIADVREVLAEVDRLRGVAE